MEVVKEDRTKVGELAVITDKRKDYPYRITRTESLAR
jgi:hypothetical protein